MLGLLSLLKRLEVRPLIEPRAELQSNDRPEKKNNGDFPVGAIFHANNRRCAGSEGGSWAHWAR